VCLAPDWLRHCDGIYESLIYYQFSIIKCFSHVVGAVARADGTGAGAAAMGAGVQAASLAHLGHHRFTESVQASLVDGMIWVSLLHSVVSPSKLRV
jgi:hypothetical protein